MTYLDNNQVIIIFPGTTALVSEYHYQCHHSVLSSIGLKKDCKFIIAHLILIVTYTDDWLDIAVLVCTMALVPVSLPALTSQCSF